MSRLAIVENGVVTNVVLAGPDYTPPAGAVACPDRIGKGWTYDEESGEFSAPVRPEPKRQKPKGVSQLDFSRKFLRREQAKRWMATVLRARRAVEADTATAVQEEIALAYEHFTQTDGIDFNSPDVQAAIYVMYIEGAFGPVYDPATGVPPTTDEQFAIDEAARMAAGIPYEEVDAPA
ncbi:hypothetical protein [Hyphobacterium sp.]|uniref:hypothetical protein n=1 Tax=Hyphobacterium sp. TaxID=2004662 RepID=UPI003B529A1A